MSDGDVKADLCTNRAEKTTGLRCPGMRGYSMVWSLPVGSAVWRGSEEGEAGREWITKEPASPLQQEPGV